MDKHQSSPKYHFVRIIFLPAMLLAVVAIFASLKYQRPLQPSCSDGKKLGAGFPALVICDDWGGGSPTNSWGRIDFVDVQNGGLRPFGLLADFLLYTFLFWLLLLLFLNFSRPTDPNTNSPTPKNHSPNYQ
ncbi:MAG: hypothetical protein WAM60_23890 [Candidatus Promineifilaceae bacterium]